jgi:ornithine cyclodeaminase/alanine dehydrogenase-like protein (mu-crystallin family)
MMERRLRFLSARDVARALPMRDAVEAMKEAFRQISAGEAVAPPRTHIAVESPPGDALFMPAYVPATGKMGLKIVTLFGDNAARGLPRIQALMIVLDAITGSPLAVMDGTSLTAIRTGAASGAATDLLARPDATVVAIFGAGPQAKTQLEAVCAVRPIRRAMIFDPGTERAEALATEMAPRLGIPVLAARSPAEALAGADIVCAATTSVEPVFADHDVAPGTHINAVGSYKPTVREIPAETVRRARVVVDHRPAALAEAGDIIIPMKQGLIEKDHICAELGEIVAGLKKGRESTQQVTLFKSVGVAVQDIAAANRILAAAERLNLGTEFAL